MSVLIESDWNLKQIKQLLCALFLNRINRIRLEFKVENGIPLSDNLTVLIESDWNLKKEALE